MTPNHKRVQQLSINSYKLKSWVFNIYFMYKNVLGASCWKFMAFLLDDEILWGIQRSIIANSNILHEIRHHWLLTGAQAFLVCYLGYNFARVRDRKVIEMFPHLFRYFYCVLQLNWVNVDCLKNQTFEEPDRKDIKTTNFTTWHYMQVTWCVSQFQQCPLPHPPG